MAWEPETGVLWVSVNERDELGNDLVPDYMTSVRDGGFYGWPYCVLRLARRHAGQAAAPGSGRAARSFPTTRSGAHTASLGLAASRGAALPAPFTTGMFVGQHGSWNRKPRSGYKVVFVPFAGGRPSGRPSTSSPDS